RAARSLRDVAPPQARRDPARAALRLDARSSAAGARPRGQEEAPRGQASEAVSSFEDDELRAPATEIVDDDVSGERADLEHEIAAAGGGADPGIALLLELARAGKIDPWNVDIIKVTDEYFRALDTLDPRDLARSGRCIFYAAALVH